MTRTPEQLAADKALTAAVEGVHRAYREGDTEAGVLTSYVVVTQRQRWDEDGDLVESVGTYTGDADVTYSQMLGLFEYAGARARKRIVTDDTEDAG